MMVDGGGGRSFLQLSTLSCGDGGGGPGLEGIGNM